jgi:SAM-dependent methyltransferase
MPEPHSPPVAPGRSPVQTMHPSLVLAVYAEELITGARVAVFGHATLGVADELLERGARLVHVYDVDPGRIAEATGSGAKRSIFYATLSDSGDIGVRDGAFDFVLVPDLSFTDRPEALLGLARRILSPAGSLLVASPNKDAADPLMPANRAEAALGYYELYEAVAAHFRFVKMIGQAPFVGYAVAEFAVDEEPEPTIDTSLAHEKEPDFFVVLASDRSTRLDPFALIELPRGELGLAHAGAGAAEGEPAADVRSAAGEAAARIAELERERDEAREDRDENVQRAHAERIRADQALQRLGARDEEISLLREQAESLRRSLEDEEARRLRLETELEPLRPEVTSLRERIDGLEKTVSAAADEQMVEVLRLEAHLRDRGHEIEQLRAELVRREKLVREMIADGALSSAVPAPPPPIPSAPPVAEPTPPSPEAPKVDGALDDLRSQLDRLAVEASRREADLVAAGWKIAELQRRLEQLQR